METSDKMLAKCEFHIIMLKGKGPLYKVADNDFRTYSDPTKVPDSAYLVCETSFSKMRSKAYAICSRSAINGQYADVYTWCDRGLRIGCVSGLVPYVKEMGEWDIVVGDVIDD